MLVRQIISQTAQRHRPTLDAAPDRLQLTKRAVFKPHAACVGDAIDGVEREHDARRLEQETRVALDKVGTRVSHGAERRSCRNDSNCLESLTYPSKSCEICGQATSDGRTHDP